MRSPLLAVSMLVVLGLGVAYAENTDKEADEAIAAFRKAFSSKEESDRITAVDTLGAIQHKRVVDALAGPLAKDASNAVRRAAAKVIGNQWSANAVTALAAALDPDDAAKDVTTAIIQALGRTESDKAVPVLLGLLTVKRRAPKGQTPAPEQEGASVFTGPALDALKRIGSATAAEELVNFLGREAAAQGGGGRRGKGGGGGGGFDPLAKNAEAALAAITGQKLQGAGEWRKWWAENKESLKTIPVHRCPGTGRTFDKLSSATKCPFDGDQKASCGYLLKTRFENGGLSAPDAAAPDGENKGGRPKKKKNE